MCCVLHRYWIGYVATWTDSKRAKKLFPGSVAVHEKLGLG